MPVMIKEINIKNLGPIPKQVDWEMGKLNLIYGKNETGKTYLVEFLINSLFKTKGWQLRPQIGNGKIMVTGLEDNSVPFSPSSSKKLEDYYPGLVEGIPPDFSKLLVVKGAEVELGEGEADKVILKRYLSSREILDKIENRISKTMQDAFIENHEIVGGNKGDIKRRNVLKKRLGSMDELFEEVNNDYLGGQRKILENKKIELENKSQEMNVAKRYYAYTISKKIEELTGKSKKVDDEKLSSTSTSVKLHWNNETGYQLKKKTYEETKEKSKQYSWAKNAAHVYEGQLQKTLSTTTNTLLLLPLIILIVLTAVFSYFNLFFGVIGSLAALVILGWLVMSRYSRSAKKGVQSAELEKINTEYENRFGHPLTGLAQLKTYLDDIQLDYNKSEVLKDQLSEEETQLQQEKNQISNEMYDLLGEDIEPSKWSESLRWIEREKKELNEKIQGEKEKLIRLDVDKLEYVTEEPSVQYNQKEHETLEFEGDATEEQLREIGDGLDNLKARIYQITDDDATISWEKLIQNLREKHKEILDEYADITAQIISQIAVMDIVKEFRKAEDEKIRDNLESEIIKKPLYEITNRYTGFRLDDDSLYVSDQFGEFPLNEVSTGAKEQVFLALRMGFCSRILKQDNLFLILDDAFQYSDWNRRQLLVNKVVDLAKNGWQVIYFTMDDNIKELFDAKGQELGADYKNFVLAEA